MTERRQTSQPLTDQELAIEIDLQDGEGSDGIGDLENFHIARSALFSAVETCMNGEHESVDSIRQQIETLLEETAQTFAAVLCAEEDFEQRLYDASKSLHSAMVDLKTFIDQFETSVKVNVAPAEKYEEGFREVLDEDDFESHYDIFEHSFGSLHSMNLTAVMAHAKDSSAEAAREKHQLRKDRLIAVSREVAKATLNAVAIVAVAKLWDKRNSN